MKKLFLFFGIVAMALNSCSYPEDTTDPSVILLKKTITHNPDGSSATADFNYDGSKITTITSSNGESIDYTYSGDLITTIKSYAGADLTTENLYTYNSSGQLVEFVMLGHTDDTGLRQVYVYNTDGTISVTHFSGDLNSQTYQLNTSTITLLPNGEVDSITHTHSGALSSFYTYDNMNSPFKNVTGRRKISVKGTSAQGIDHNITSETIGSGVSPRTYTYNAAGYPVTSVKVYYGQTTSMEYFYE